MKKLFSKFTITQLLLTAIAGVMFIGCSDDEDDKRSSISGREVNWKYSIKDDNCIWVRDEGMPDYGYAFIYVTRISENEIIFSEWIPCKSLLNSLTAVKYIRVRNKIIKY